MMRALSGPALLILAANVGHSQQPESITIPDEATCPRCTIVTQVVTTLGTAEGPGSLSGPGFVMADARGRYWVLFHGETPRVFDANGRFIGSVGTIGEGPGEFQAAISGMPIPGDSVAIFDGRGRTTIVGPDLAVARMIRTPFQIIFGVPTAWPSAAIVNGTAYSGDGVGLPLHRVSFAQSLLVETSHFGPDEPTRQAGAMRGSMHTLSAARSGGAWAADVNRFRVVHWSPRGERLATLEHRPAWFSSVSGQASYGRPTAPPDPGIAAIHEDAQNGNLWVFARVPATTWRDAWPSGSTGARELSVRSIAVEKLFTMRIEVINPTTGRVVARGTMNDMVLTALPDRRVATYVVDSAGIPRINIVSVRIREP